MDIHPGARMIVKKRTLDRSVQELWKAWTSHEGLKSFFGRDNEVELRPGGKFEIYFLMDREPGFRGSESCQVLSFLPEKMLSFSWNVPPHFEELRRSCYRTWVVVLFNALSEGRTELVLSHLGWPDEADWDKAYTYFDEAWDEVLGGL